MEWSGGKRTLVGCAIGCGALVVVAIGLAVGFGLWLNAPGEILEPQRLLGADTTGFVELRLSLDDPETAAFVERLITGLQSIAPEDAAGLPAPIAAFLRANREEKTRADIERLFPAVAAWTLRRGEGPDDDVHLLSVSLERASHQLIVADFVLGMAMGREEGTRKHAHLDETIYEFIAKDGSIAVFIDRGILFVTTEVDVAKRTVDRLREPVADDAPATPLDRLFDALPGDRPLRGAISNADGAVRRLWTQLAADGGAAIDEAMWASLRGIGLSAALEPDGSLAGFVDVALADAGRAIADAEAWRDAFVAAVPAEGRERGLEVSASAIESAVRIDVRVPQLLGSADPPTD